MKIRVVKVGGGEDRVEREEIELERTLGVEFEVRGGKTIRVDVDDNGRLTLYTTDGMIRPWLLGAANGMAFTVVPGNDR